MSGSRETPEEQRHRAFMEAQEAMRKANEMYMESQERMAAAVQEILEIERQRVAPDMEKLRDWFAGQALTAMLVNQPDADRIVAQNAYRYADAMLEERDTTP